MNIEHQLKSKLAWSLFQKSEIKTKILATGAMTTAKNNVFIFFIGLNWLLVGREQKFGGNEQIFGWWGRLPQSPSRENPVYILYIYMLYIQIYKSTLPTDFYIQWRSSMYITYIMCQSRHLTSARFVCHRYMWCIFLLACSLFVIHKIYYVMNMFNQASDGRIVYQKSISH